MSNSQQRFEQGQMIKTDPSATATAIPAPLIDAHIHLDTYADPQASDLLASLKDFDVAAVIAVSMHLQSSRHNRELAKSHPGFVYPAFGFHPEQPIPSADEIEQLFTWMEEHADEMVAVGEVGLPYYSRAEAAVANLPFDSRPYEELLERFIGFARDHSKPIVLHAVYEDADIACRLLEQYGVNRAHFHWFKGSRATVDRMAANGYYISFTPDIVYESEIQELARVFPADQVMAETDGPWPFEGPFEGRVTHPRMTADVIEMWSQLQRIPLLRARSIMNANTRNFYGI